MKSAQKRKRSGGSQKRHKERERERESGSKAPNPKTWGKRKKTHHTHLAGGNLLRGEEVGDTGRGGVGLPAFALPALVLVCAILAFLLHLLRCLVFGLVFLALGLGHGTRVRIFAMALAVGGHAFGGAQGRLSLLRLRRVCICCSHSRRLHFSLSGPGCRAQAQSSEQ